MRDLSRDHIVIAIDGPAGAGKSTVARILAKKLGIVLLDTGGLYRVMALHLMRQGVDPEQKSIPSEVLQAFNLQIETGDRLHEVVPGR